MSSVSPALLNMLGIDPGQAAEIQKFLNPASLAFWRSELSDANARSKVLLAKVSKLPGQLADASHERIALSSQIAALQTTVAEQARQIAALAEEIRADRANRGGPRG